MSALPKFDAYHHQQPRERPQTAKPTPLIPSPKQQLPTALQVLLGFQQTTSWMTLGMVSVALSIYGWTVYTPLLWSQEYQALKALQKTERQLVTNTEAIKHQLALEADRPNSGLVNPNPSQNLFLPIKQNGVSTNPLQNDGTPPTAFSLSATPIAY